MRLKLRGIYNDIFITFLTEFTVLAGFFIVYRLLAYYFGADGVGEYSLTKRVVGFFQPFLFLGLGLGLSRYLAIAKDDEQKRGYIQAGCYAALSITLIFIALINLFKKEFASLVLGSARYAVLVVPLSALLFGLVLHAIVYSYFRGVLRVKLFNVLQIINLALVPIVAVFTLREKNVENLIFITGIWTSIVGLIFFLIFVKNIITPAREIAKRLKELMIYSLPRFAGDLMLAGLFSLGPILAAHVIAIKEVGYLSINQSLLSSVSTAIAPLGLVLLPKISNMVAQGRADLVRKNVNFLIGAVVQCSLFLCAQLIIFSDAIIMFWLGPEFLPAVPAMRITFFSILFYNFYVSARSVLDASVIKPVNTINLFMSLVVFLILSFWCIFSLAASVMLTALSVALTVALALLGILTYFSLKKIYPGGYTKDISYFAISVAINVVLSIVTLTFKPLIISNLLIFIFFEVIAGFVYLFTLYLVKTDWLTQIKIILIEN